MSGTRERRVRRANAARSMAYSILGIEMPSVNQDSNMYASEGDKQCATPHGNQVRPDLFSGNLMGFGCAHGGWKHSLLISVMRSIIQNRPDRRGDPVFHKIVLFFFFIMSPIVAVADPSDGWTDPDDSSDDLDLESETDEEKKAAEEAEKNRLGEDDSLDLLDDEDALDMIEEEPTEENTGDLLEQEIGKDVIGGEGEDNSTIYRQAQTTNGRMIPDEEMIAWEQYLEQYPNSLYKSRIEKRMEELEAVLYDQLIEQREPERLDADQRELLFARFKSRNAQSVRALNSHLNGACRTI